MRAVNFKIETSGNLNQVIEETTQSLKNEGFGVLTRIDLHLKIKEKIGKTIPPTVILGVCNPNSAFKAYTTNPDVASLMPCNAVIRELAPGRFSVELAKPSVLMGILEDQRLKDLAQNADEQLEKALGLITKKAV